jgi:hypothetical protein
MEEIKKSYHSLRMWNEPNKVAGMCGFETVNRTVLVLHTRLWPSRDLRGLHMLNVLLPHNHRDIWRSEILHNRHVIPGCKLAFFRIYFCFFFALFKKSHNLYVTNCEKIVHLVIQRFEIHSTVNLKIVNINDVSYKLFNNVSIYNIIRDKLFENNDMLSSILNE